MKFGRIPLDEATGAILAHGVRHAAGLFKKGRVLSAADIKLLHDAGLDTVYAARLDSDDVPEDEAAGAVARAIAGVGTKSQEPFTGRANLHAQAPGLVVIDSDRVRELNRLHESLTLATAANHERVAARQMVATVKVIPFAVPRPVLTRALAIIGDEPVVRVEGFRPRHAGLVITRLPQTKPSLIKKSEASMRARVSALGGSVDEVVVCDHAVEPIKQAVRRLHTSRLNPILIFGSSAIVDRGDVIPQGLIAAGGEIVHLGMPVDPGNLLMLGRLDGVTTIGVPSCARSPKVNGFDWVLERVMAGLHVTAQDIMDMGAGGLLKEIPTRPAPREDAKAQKAPIIAAIVLAAGRSSRMGESKMLVDFRGKPLIRVTVEAVLGSAASPVVVVTGNQAEDVRAALDGLDVVIADNPDYAQGLSTSLRTGLAALPADVAGAVVCLGDMPLVEPAVIDRLIAAFSPAEGRLICVPTYDGKLGNPVLWGREFFAEMSQLSGDRGARSLLDAHGEQLVEVPVSGDAILVDIDTPDVLERLRSA
ncbi:MAG: molybdopterin-binding/glycosyltransferase family 2 protein [Rhizobiales bacterium]|nr:molybdopterin-binding/glycosyltransferase family 2 protein [Hyphomicrobiales bacterium]